MKRLIFCAFFISVLITCVNVKSFSKDNAGIQASIEEIRMGETLDKLVKDKDYDKVFCLLDKIVVKDGLMTQIVPFNREIISTMALGGNSSICIYDSTGTKLVSTNFDEDFWSYFQVEKSKMGAWQVYLLHNMWHYLPLWWHSNYARRSYVYSKSSKIELEGVLDDEESSFNQAITTNDVTPSIKQEGDEFFISACYWTIHGGLYREKCVVKFHGDKVTIKNIDSNVLFEYDCGLVY
jgi:hypothetical protein